MKWYIKMQEQQFVDGLECLSRFVFFKTFSPNLILKKTRTNHKPFVVREFYLWCSLLLFPLQELVEEC